MAAKSKSKLPSVIEVIGHVRSLDQAGVDNSSCGLFHGLVDEGNMLYLPPGWISFETCTAPSTGIHVSILPDSDAAKTNYSALVETIKSAASDPSKLAIYSENDFPKSFPSPRLPGRLPGPHSPVLFPEGFPGPDSPEGFPGHRPQTPRKSSRKSFREARREKREA